jgi:hypothetical protein
MTTARDDFGIVAERPSSLQKVTMKGVLPGGGADDLLRRLAINITQG